AAGEPGDRSDRSGDGKSGGGARRVGPGRRRGESIDADHGPQPDRGYRETNRARRARPQIDPRDRGVANAMTEVQLFATCLAEEFFPEVNDAAATVLERLRLKVTPIRGAFCCGQVAFNEGMREQAVA